MPVAGKELAFESHARNGAGVILRTVYALINGQHQFVPVVADSLVGLHHSKAERQMVFLQCAHKPRALRIGQKDDEHTVEVTAVHVAHLGLNLRAVHSCTGEIDLRDVCEVIDDLPCIRLLTSSDAREERFIAVRHQPE